MIKKILIVDDSPIARKILKNCFPKDAHPDIHEAGDGLAGLEMFKTLRPDITFMDLTMPVMDGTQSLAEIKKSDPHAVVIVCTADVQLQSIEKVMKLGALLVLKKPPTKETVLEALSQAKTKLQANR